MRTIVYLLVLFFASTSFARERYDVHSTHSLVPGELFRIGSVFGRPLEIEIPDPAPSFNCNHRFEEAPEEVFHLSSVCTDVDLDFDIGIATANIQLTFAEPEGFASDDGTDSIESAVFVDLRATALGGEFTEGYVGELRFDRDLNLVTSLQVNDLGGVDISTGGLSGLTLLTNNSPTISYLPGDADLDGRVGFADFAILMSNFQRETSGPSWEFANFDDDDRVGFADFALLARNFGERVQSTAVPEPGMSMCGAFVLLLITRRLTPNVRQGKLLTSKQSC